MCGINGFISLKNPADFCYEEDIKNEIHLMNDLIAHRGPDSEGIYVKTPICFGFRRLSIIDLTEDANQPMLSNDGEIVIVFNGEIYNYIEIKKELISKGYIFKTQSDTEVILNSYKEYGVDCVNRFNGMWAFALYDFRKSLLLCSRDRFGVKPFYYYFTSESFYFSSELKALHSVCNLRKANISKVYEYLAYGYRVNDGETFLQDCFELLPGTNFIYEKNQSRFQKYWKLKPGLFVHDEKRSYYEEYLQLLESSVKLRYRSDVPVALLLSGGMDSSSIAKVTDNLIERGELANNSIQAFIASFPNFLDDETPIAREFIKTCKHIHLNEMVLDSKNIISNFENTIYGMDHPLFSFTSMVHHNIMRECSKRGLKVVLNGQGSDEAFAGYVSNISGAYLLDQLLTEGGNFIKEFSCLNKQNKYSKLFLVSQLIKTTLNQSKSSYLRARYQEHSISCLNNNFVKENYDHFKPEYKFSIKGSNFTNYLLYHINQQGLNKILHYEDVSSMQNSIEIRSPFMDYRLMEFAFSIPNDLRFKKGITKVIQRETIGKLLPDSITKNRRKIGFTTPFQDFLSNDDHIKSFVFDMLNSSSFLTKGIWKSDNIANVFKNPTSYPNFPFWRVINLEVWSKVYNINNL